MKKQKSGLYRTAVTVAGEKVWLSARTKAELEEKKREVRERLVYGVSEQDITFHQLVEKWMNEVRIPSGVRPSTIQNQRTLINKWILPNMDKRQYAMAVRRADMQKIIDKMGSLTYDYKVDCKKVLVAICFYGQQLGCMRANFAINLVIPKEQRDASVHVESIPDEDVARLFNAAGKYQLQIALLYYTGMRRGEAIAVTWADVDFEQKTILVNKSFDSKSRLITKTKTRNGIRKIPLHNHLAQLLLPLKGDPDKKVLSLDSDHAYRLHWVSICKKAGLVHKNDSGNLAPDYTPHQLRHSYATKLHQAGIDQLTASRIMGHSSYSTTANIYTDVSISQTDKQAIQKTFAIIQH